MDTAPEDPRTCYEVPMQENGRVILPAALRRSLGLAKGDRVIIETEGETVTLTTARLRRRKAQRIAARYAQPERDVVEEFLSDKRAEAEREAAALDAPRTRP